MGQETTGGFCANCNKQVSATRHATSHILHLLLTLCTLGVWAIVWIFLSITKIGGWRCTACGSRRVTTGIFGWLSKSSHEKVVTSQYIFQAASQRTCPYCAEAIKAEAIICRFCNRDIAPLGPAGPAATGSQFVTFPNKNEHVAPDLKTTQPLPPKYEKNWLTYLGGNPDTKPLNVFVGLAVIFGLVVAINIVSAAFFRFSHNNISELDGSSSQIDVEAPAAPAPLSSQVDASALVDRPQTQSASALETVTGSAEKRDKSTAEVAGASTQALASQEGKCANYLTFDITACSNEDFNLAENRFADEHKNWFYFSPPGRMAILYSLNMFGFGPVVGPQAANAYRHVHMIVSLDDTLKLVTLTADSFFYPATLQCTAPDCPVSVRFDKGQLETFATQGGGVSMNIVNTDDFLNDMRKAKKASIVFPLDKYGNVVFEFDVSDFKW